MRFRMLALLLVAQLAKGPVFAWENEIVFDPSTTMPGSLRGARNGRAHITAVSPVGTHVDGNISILFSGAGFYDFGTNPSHLSLRRSSLVNKLTMDALIMSQAMSSVAFTRQQYVQQCIMLERSPASHLPCRASRGSKQALACCLWRFQST